MRQVRLVARGEAEHDAPDPGRRRDDEARRGRACGRREMNFFGVLLAVALAPILAPAVRLLFVVLGAVLLAFLWGCKSLATLIRASAAVTRVMEE